MLEIVQCLKDEGILVEKAKNAFQLSKIRKDSVKIDFTYSALCGYLERATCESFNISDALDLLENFFLKNDELL